MPESIPVTCAHCGAEATITAPAEEAASHENRFKCPACEQVTVIPGEPGHPGEGALNPAASALSDEELAEAYQRRIAGSTEPIIHSTEVGGTVGATGEATGGPA